ncbi:MAG: hypothetical protein ACRD07_19620 [Acidimicrobiales bacterium]
MRFDVDEWGDWIYRVGDALGRFELALAVVIVAGGVGAGVAILLVLPLCGRLSSVPPWAGSGSS